MKILFVHEVSWFKKVVFEMHDFPELLSLRGHEVSFLEFDEGGETPIRKLRTSIESRAHPGSKVIVKSPPRILPGIAGRLLTTLVHPIVFLFLVFKNRPDVVVSYSIPTSGWQISILCRLMNVPIILRIIDIPHLLRKSHFNNLVKFSERVAMKSADRISTHNRVLKDYCVGLGANPETTVVIWPGCDVERFSFAAPSVGLQESLGIRQGDNVLMFMGTIFRFSGLYEVVGELARHLRDDPTLKLLVIGDGEDLARLNDLVLEENLSQQVIFTGRIDYKLLPAYVQLGTVALLPFQSQAVTHHALPGKILQYLACGIPTVARSLDGLKSTIPHGEGITYVNSTIELVNEALQLVEDSGRRHDLSQRGSSFVARNFNWEVQIQLFEQMLIDCIDGK